MLIDSHAHLTDKRLDAKQIIRDMPECGIGKIVCVGYDIASSKKSVELAQNNKDIYAAVGIHPSDIRFIKNDDLDILFDLAKNEKVVAFGEIGLDYHYDNTDKAKQGYYLEKQIDIASSLELPVVFHVRDADGDMERLIKKNSAKLKHSAVMHCFCGSKETALHYANMGFYISFSGVITFANASRYADIIRAVPKDKLLIETDCPYLAPEPMRGKTNYPEYIRFTAIKMAQILDESFEYVAELTSNNALRLMDRIK